MEATFQPSTADGYLRAQNPTTNYGSNINIPAGPYASTALLRGLLRFDFSSIGAAAISAARLQLYYRARDDAGNTGRTIEINELTQTAWVESECCWNYYAGTTSWSSAGGDFTTANQATAVVPANIDVWMEWNVLALIQHFQNNHSSIANFLLKDSNETATSALTTYFSSRDNSNADQRPKLVITYNTGIIPAAMHHLKMMRG